MDAQLQLERSIVLYTVHYYYCVYHIYFNFNKYSNTFSNFNVQILENIQRYSFRYVTSQIALDIQIVKYHLSEISPVEDIKNCSNLETSNFERINSE